MKHIPNLMKNYLLGLLFIFAATFAASSQTFSYGLKGGINYSMGGEITGKESPPNGDWAETIEGEGEIGYHGGLFVQVNFGKIFIRPEVVYTSIESTFQFPNRPSIYSVEKLDIPLLVGYNIWGPVDVFAGPVYSNILESSLEGDQETASIVVQETPINAQIGAKVEFGRFGFDIRYERNLSSPEDQQRDMVENGPDGYGANVINFDDARLHQIIVGVIFKIGGPGLNERRRRACY